MDDHACWNFFDARCKVGRHAKLTDPACDPHTAVQLLADMDHMGVAEALVLDCLAQESDPAAGNTRVLEICRQSDRLHPAWTLLPPGSGEQPEPAALLSAMQHEKVGAAWLFPRQFAFTLEEWCLDDLIEPLAAARVPLFICDDEVGPRPMAADQTDWTAVVNLCRRWPDLPVVVSEYRIRRSQRLIYRALDGCENLHLELSGYWLHHGIEYITRRWSSRRLLFGSHWPEMGQDLMVPTLACAEIEDEHKRDIAGDNLRRLMAWCAPAHPKVTLPPPADELVAWGRSGQRPDTIELHDNHGHVGMGSAHYHVPDGDLDGLVHEMDRLGVARVCVFSLSGVFTDEVHGNNATIEAVQRFPDRFVGFTLLNPHRGRDAMWAELERCAAAGLRGVKLIPTYQGYPEEGPNIDVACQWVHERRQIILNHEWGSAAQMQRLVTTYPDACFFTGHTTLKYASLMQKHANLYVCSCPVNHPGIVEKVVASIGADRFMFGSDLSDLPIAWGFGPILFARISEHDKRLILGENLCRVLETYSLQP